jgi:hypothetical protein
MINEEELNQIIDNLAINGYIEVDGIDAESGEFLYKVSDKLNELIPNWREKVQEAFLDEVYNLWVKGFVTMDMTQLSPTVRLTEDALDPEKVSKLSLDEKTTLSTIMAAMKKD